jgi:hypothetical protein
MDVEGAIGPAGDGDLRHAVTLASQPSMHGWLAVTSQGCRAPLSVGERFYSEDRHKPAAYIVGACDTPWIELP